jgi:hypothetical protein
VAPFATLQDWQNRYAVTLSGPAASQVQALLEEASAMIRGNLPTGYTPEAVLARGLTLTMAHRAKVNPGGRRRRELGDYSEDLGEAGGMYMTQGEIDALLPSQFGDGDAAYTVLPADF